MHRIVVVGASLAGVHAVEALREAGFDGAIDLIGAENHLPYDRPPLVAAITGKSPEPSLLRESGWFQEHGVTLHLGCAAGALWPEERTILLSDGGALRYDGVVVATGSRSRTGIAGSHHVLYLRSSDDASELRNRLVGAERVVIIGAGFLGLELAATVSAQGRAVKVVELAPSPMARLLGDEVGEWFRALHTRRGVEVSCDAHAIAVEKDGQGYVVHLHNGLRVEADLVLGATGASPAVEWLRDSGLSLSDGVLCDERLRTSAPDVVAAGDVARWYNPLFDETMRVEQWTNAVEQGRHAALSLLGSDAVYAPVPYFWSDQYDAKMRFVGRSNAATNVHVSWSSDTSLVALYGRDGVHVGALCVNATAQLARHREAIRNRAPYTWTA